MFNVVKGENFGFKYINDSVIEKYHNKGFNDVPNNHDGIRPWIGPFVIDDINYYLPLSSQEKCEIEFKQDGKVLGGVNVKWMTPFSNGVIKEYDIDNKINEQKNIIKQNNKVEAFKAKDIRYLEAEKEKAAVAVKRLEFEKEYIKNDANLDELRNLVSKHRNRNEAAAFYNSIESFYKDFIIKELTQTINNSSVEKINELKNENEELKNAYKELEEKYKDLQSINIGNIRTSNGNLKKANNEINKLKGNIKREEEKANKQEEKLKEANTKIEELQAQVKKLQEEKEKLLTKVAELQGEKAELRSKLDVVNTALVRLQHERNTAYKKLEGLQRPLKPANKKEDEKPEEGLLKALYELRSEQTGAPDTQNPGEVQGGNLLTNPFLQSRTPFPRTIGTQDLNMMGERSFAQRIKQKGKMQLPSHLNGLRHATTPLPSMNKKLNNQKKFTTNLIGDLKKNSRDKRKCN